MEHPENSLKKFVVSHDNKLFVDTKILDYLSDSSFSNKWAKFKPIVEVIIEGTGLKIEEVIVKTQVIRDNKKLPIVAIAIGIIKILIVRGFKGFGWTQKREQFITHFFAPSLIPTYNPFGLEPQSYPTPVEEQDITADSNSELESTQPLNCSRMQRGRRRKLRPVTTGQPTVLTFAKSFHGELRRHRKQKKTSPKILQNFMRALFAHRGKIQTFRESLSIELTAGSPQSIITLIRNRLKWDNTNVNLIPSFRSICRTNQELKQHFLDLLKPTRTYSGFRVSLVSYVRFAAFFLLKRTDLTGIHVDIWGDGLERGNREVTRFAFRFLCDSADLNPQSANSVFTFAAFFGKDSRYNMEKNIGWTVVGEQKSSWLYMETKTLSSFGCLITLSGDSPFVHRIVCGITGESSNVSPSEIPMYVESENEEKYGPFAVSATGRRIDLLIPLRETLPETSLIWLPNTCAVCPDVSVLLKL